MQTKIDVTEFCGNKPTKKKVGVILGGVIYLTVRRKKHYFRIFKGFGLSIDVYNQLVENKVEYVIIDYYEDRIMSQRFLSQVNQWKLSSERYENQILDGRADPQYVLPIDEMIKLQKRDVFV